VRLSGGPSTREGRLEVYYNGTWGTVCDYGFSHAAAIVSCRSLGFRYVFCCELGTFLCLFLCSNCSVWSDCNYIQLKSYISIPRLRTKTVRPRPWSRTIQARLLPNQEEPQPETRRSRAVARLYKTSIYIDLITHRLPEFDDCGWCGMSTKNT